MTCLSRYLSQVWIFWNRNFQSFSVIHHLNFKNKEVGDKSEKKIWKISKKNFWKFLFATFCFKIMKLMPEKIMNLQGSWIVKSWNVRTPCICILTYVYVFCTLNCFFDDTQMSYFTANILTVKNTIFDGEISLMHFQCPLSI